MPSSTKTINVKVQDSFKKSEFWQNGIIFLNERKKYDRSGIFSFADIKLTELLQYSFKTGYSKEMAIFDDAVGLSQDESKITLTYRLSNFGRNVVRKALNRIEFYKFSNLRLYFPNLSSIDEFLTSGKFIGSIEVEVTGTSYRIANITNGDKVDIATFVLDKVAKEIDTGAVEFIGTREFKPYSIKNTVRDKTLNIVIDDTGDQEYGIPMREPKNPVLKLDLRNTNWYVYDENYGTSEEKYLVKFINSVMEQLENYYDEIFLLRNERLFQLYRFSDGRPMEPDFVIFLREKITSKPVMYQLFVEAKGTHLVLTDKWKEDFLKEIEKEYGLGMLFENEKYRIIGMPFYNESNKKAFIDRFKEVLLTK